MHYIQPTSYAYYYGRLRPEEVEQLLRKKNASDGLFLLYQHLFESSTYVLSICFRNDIKHYRIERRKNRKVFLGASPDFISPIELVEYLKTNGTLSNLVISPRLECNRFKNTDPIGYLFISVEDLNNGIEKELKKYNKESYDDYSCWYECEKEVLKKIHLSQKWFLKNIKKSAVETLFKDYGFHDGKFLLRSNLFKNYKLAVCYENQVHHYKIECNDQKYSIHGSCVGKEFKYIAQLIDFYGRSDHGILKCKLTMPYNVNVLKNEKYICDTNELYKGFLLDNEELLSYYRLVNNESTSFTSLMTKIPSTVIENIITEGINSKILKGHYFTKSNRIDVAIKILKTKRKNDEIKIISSLNHSNIVKMIEPIENIRDDLRDSVLIFEYAENGSLENFLIKNLNLKLNFVVNLLIQIGSALAYLTNKKIVHRDIAARNILLFENNFAKLCDFGKYFILQFYRIGNTTYLNN